MINTARLFYAKPSTFNDPLDSNPTVRVDLDVKDVEKLLYRMVKRREGADKAKHAIGKHRYYVREFGNRETDPEVADYYLRRMSSHIQDLVFEVFKDYGVLSLAEKWDCPLMWSHYADNHSGICIEYDMRQSEFTELRPVSYQRPRSINLSDVMAWVTSESPEARDKILSTFFFAKAPQWKYEREWRSISKSNGPEHAPVDISAFYFGLRCDPSVMDAIVKLYRPTPAPIKFYALRAKDETFGLERHLLDAEEIVQMPVQRSAILEFRDVFVDETQSEALLSQHAIPDEQPSH